ncbi:uncharacterized protein LOC123864831 [Maniola jurtina]|uniref:uncharacterized protein LOC123864831 n=1 Tax=Maniola jurtina TaxID=191418 RepID=UPI001E68E6B9|nr:uncharacterized protein LOC123864831 [Maniola jurtina]
MPCGERRMSEPQLLERNCLNEGSMSVPVNVKSLQPHWKEFACGGGAAFCNILLSYPLNKLIFRQMMHGVEATFALGQLRKEGMGYLYRGMLPPLLQRSMSMSLMFGVYDECLQPLLEYKVNPYVAKTVAGVVAGCVEATLMPFERLQTLLIHPKYHNQFKNTAHASSHIARYYGIKEFYRGLVPILLRNGPSNAMFFIIRDEVRLRLPKQENLVYEGIQNFIAGASIGAFLSTLFYPLNVIKIAMQCELGGPHRTLVYEFNYILRKRGSKFTNFYHGALLNISRAFLKSKRPKYRDDYRYEKAFDAFYKLHPEAVNWHQSRIRCEAEGTELFVPANLDEADSIPLLIAPILTKYEGVYVGIHDLYSERTFVTINGSSLQDTILELLWELTQPLHSGGRCVAMRRNGKLFVNPCSENLPFACKIKASRIIYYPECDTFDSRWKLGPNATCYLTHVEPQPWHVAYSTCYSAGGHLAILDTREEAEYTRELFKQIDQHKTPGDFAFLGFSDLFQRYHYRTVLGGKLPANQINWDFKCPGNFTKLEDRCGGIRRSGLLATGTCGIPSMFFCEKPATGSFKHKKTLRNDPNRYRNKHKVFAKLEDTMLEEYT